jgi:hypothetical protein
VLAVLPCNLQATRKDAAGIPRPRTVSPRWKPTDADSTFKGLSPVTEHDPIPGLTCDLIAESVRSPATSRMLAAARISLFCG